MELDARQNLEIEKKLQEFFQIMPHEKLIGFAELAAELLEVFQAYEDCDWDEIMANEDTRNVKIIRTVYIMSRLAEDYSGTLALVRVKYKDFWRKLEKISQESVSS